MKHGQIRWTREEQVLVLNLYYKLSFGRMHARNPEVIHLASLLGRTSNSVAFKLVNYASLDPTHQARGIKGASNATIFDRQIWNEFFGHWDLLPYESEKLLAGYEHTTVEQLNHIPEHELPKEGAVREQMIKVRVNQSFFRKSILASYSSTCCITGINTPELLVAGHIVPWSVDEKNRLNPQNGIALNALHDRAFETGLITISLDLKVKVSPLLLKREKDVHVQEYFLRYHEQPIIEPARLPHVEFLRYHNEIRFRQ